MGMKIEIFGIKRFICKDRTCVHNFETGCIFDTTSTDWKPYRDFVLQAHTFILDENHQIISGTNTHCDNYKEKK